MINHEPQNPSPHGAVPRSGSEEAGPRQILAADTTDLIHRALAGARTDDQGWVYMAELDGRLRLVAPGFRPSRLGFDTLPELLEACAGVETGVRDGAFVAKLRVASN